MVHREAGPLLFAKDELSGYLRNMLLDTKRTIHEHAMYDSTTERDFADALEKNEGVVLYAELMVSGE